MSGRRRRELTDSFRLVATDEQWFLRDLLVGVVAAVVWIAGTGALATQVADVVGVSLGLAPGATPSPVAVAVFGVLWLAVPAVAVVVRLRRRVLNIHDNVEQYYRFDQPAALLAPPALLVAVVGAAGVALRAFSWQVSLVLLPVGLFVLLRTLAFSYRVYSFSHPLLVQALVAASTAVALGSALTAIGTAAGRAPLVDQAVRTAGLPAWIFGSVSVEGVAVSGVAVTAALPVVLALAYVLVQTVVSVGVRLVQPAVDRSAMRTGQRYPPFLESVTPVGTSAGSGESTSPSTGADDDNVSTAPDDAETEPADATGSDDADDEEDLDDVSNTRVFTPPAEDGDAGFGPGSGVEDGTGSASADAEAASGTAGETRAVPGADADETPTTTDSRDRCDACGESFSVDTAVRFCPNCGTALDGE